LKKQFQFREEIFQYKFNSSKNLKIQKVKDESKYIRSRMVLWSQWSQYLKGFVLNNIVDIEYRKIMYVCNLIMYEATPIEKIVNSNTNIHTHFLLEYNCMSYTINQ
jgi:F420-0:gamma-glutamyl ligase-like protein